MIHLSREQQPSANEEAADWEQEAAHLTRRSQSAALLRLALFALFSAGLITGSTKTAVLAGIVVPAFIAFIFVFLCHERMLRRRKTLETRIAVARESAARSASRQFSRPAPAPPVAPAPEALLRGERVYAREPHAFPIDAGVFDDLQLFGGAHSLCGFLDASSTVFGALRLRYFLSHPLLDANDIRERQEAVAESAADPALGRRILETLWPLRSHDFEALPRALRAAPQFTGGGAPFLVASVLGTAAPAALAAGFIWSPLFSIAVVLLAVNALVVAIFGKRARLARNRILAFTPFVDGLLALAACLPEGTLRGQSWRQLAVVIAGAASSARRLRWSLRLLEFHTYGVLFEIVNVIVLWELRVLPRAERLLARHAAEFEAAMGAIGECEALLSLAGPLAQQRGFTLPHVLDLTAPHIEAEALAHPLLEPENAIANRLQLAAGENVWIITGSNMSGKSTYLKAVGLNMLLAGAGGPICGAGMRWTPVELYTDVNIRDSLDDGKSYFQVEVERVRNVIDAAARTPMILAIFDELFRGTNSIERLAIARAILRVLRSRGILVLAATHDGALTRLADEDAEAGMKNLHFREEVRNKQMAFDYALREGAAPTRNAVRVLDVSGYPRSLIDEVLGELRETASGASPKEST